VRAPIVVQSTPLTALFGEVLGPNEVPLFGVTAEYPALQRVERTDVKGRSHFASVPEDTHPKQLLLRHNRSELQVQVDKPTTEAAPVAIHFDPTTH
jgi:hypothetical protein